MRRFLDALYDEAAALAALSVVGLLVMVLLSIVSRLLLSAFCSGRLAWAVAGLQ